MQISEIFFSIQGESSYAGLPCIFIRLYGCNLGCLWCDTEYARSGGAMRRMDTGGVVAEIASYPCTLVEITGGEPLLQEEAFELAERLIGLDYKVLIETNGSLPLAPLDERAIKIIDVKCPSSGEGGSFLMENLDCIGPCDEVKFVIAGKKDYDFAKIFIETHLACLAGAGGAGILFSPLSGTLEARELAGWILEDGINVRLQTQLHKEIWEAHERM